MIVPVRAGRAFFRLQTKTRALLNFGLDGPPDNRIAAAREDIFSSVGYANVFVGHNVLSASECKALVAAGEEFGFENLEGEYPASYRANDRVLLHDPV